MVALPYNDKLIELAYLIAIYPPIKRGEYARYAKVHWRYIEELRAELEDMGIDWRGIAKNKRELKDKTTGIRLKEDK